MTFSENEKVLVGLAQVDNNISHFTINSLIK